MLSVPPVEWMDRHLPARNRTETCLQHLDVLSGDAGGANVSVFVMLKVEIVRTS